METGWKPLLFATWIPLSGALIMRHFECLGFSQGPPPCAISSLQIILYGFQHLCPFSNYVLQCNCLSFCPNKCRPRPFHGNSFLVCSVSMKKVVLLFTKMIGLFMLLCFVYASLFPFSDRVFLLNWVEAVLSNLMSKMHLRITCFIKNARSDHYQKGQCRLFLYLGVENKC